MRKCGVAIAMTSAALATLSLAAPAHATNNDLFVCRMTDTHHNALVYSFGYNTMASRGAQGAGTYVEVAFAKNGQFVSSPVGSRPIWTRADTSTVAPLCRTTTPAMPWASNTTRAAVAAKLCDRSTRRGRLPGEPAASMLSIRLRLHQHPSATTATCRGLRQPLSPLTRVMSRDRLLPLLQLRLRLRLWWLRLRLCPTAWPWNQTVPTGTST